MEALSIVRAYIDMLQRQLGFDIVIYDECGLFRHTALATIGEIGKWHTTPYCLKIKEESGLRRHCVALKPAFIQKVGQGEGVSKSTCFCGVTEYVAPIRYRGHLLCMVAAVGYRGEVREGVARCLARRVGLPYEGFMALRAASLRTVAREEDVTAAVALLRQLLTRAILEETDIPQRIEAARPRGNEHVLKAMEYIAAHFAAPLSAAAVAGACHLNVSYLQHLFTETVGHGIAEEIRLRRLAYAEELLCTTSCSVRYIALQAGFTSPDYFSTVFKDHFGETPLRYRKTKARGAFEKVPRTPQNF